MVYGAGAAAAAAAIVTLALTVAEMAGDARVVRAIIANAMKASGAIVRVKPDAFEKIIARIDEPLVVRAKGGWRIKNYQYLTAYRDLFSTPNRHLRFYSSHAWKWFRQQRFGYRISRTIGERLQNRLREKRCHS
ncbi:MAG: hypothetical protein AAGB97_06385 [Dehalococcoidia bacterium]|nr:hypothetical protein [Chloroflexota bacterium]MBT9162574.1 hypothetical protein [Chloroflexota bacterium]